MGVGGDHSHTVSATGSTTYTPAGTLNTVEAHKHAYKAPSQHTHTINLIDATATGSATVPVAAHVHTVGVAAHTHSLSNHTHKVGSSGATPS